MTKAALENPSGFKLHFFTAGTAMISRMWEGIQSRYQTLKEDLTSSLSTLSTVAAEIYDEFSSIGKNIVNAIKNAIKYNAYKVANALSDVIWDAIDAIKRSLGIGSDSKLFYGYGRNILGGLVSGIVSLSDAPAEALNNALAGLGSGLGSEFGAADTSSYAAAARQGGAAGSTYYITNKFGPDSVRSDKDIYTLTEQIQRSLTLRGDRSVIA